MDSELSEKDQGLTSEQLIVYDRQRFIGVDVQKKYLIQYIQNYNAI